MAQQPCITILGTGLVGTSLGMAILSAKGKEVEVLGHDIDFAQATIFNDRFHPEQFDVVLSFRVLHVLDDVPAALRRIHELLKPGGVFISVTPCMSAYRVVFGPLFFLARITRLVPIRVQYFALPKLQALMTAAGFEVLETEKMDDRIPTFCVAARRG